MKMSPPRQTGLINRGAVRPQTPHRLPRQAFGGNFQYGLAAASTGKTTHLNFFLDDYMPSVKPTTQESAPLRHEYRNSLGQSARKRRKAFRQSP